ncbi:MAG: BNR repeat protein, partial [archaeon GW2011_AR13]
TLFKEGSISAGYLHTCGIRANDSRVLCWGESLYGRLGDGQNGTNVLNPNVTTDSSAYTSVSAGYYNTCGIRASDSRVLCWGSGNYGQLGDNSTDAHTALNPNITTDASPYSRISAGYYYTCGIRQNDSRVLCWGRGDWGNLGDDSTATHNVATPNLTTDISAYSSVNAGQYHTCGIRANDSRVLCWGMGSSGQIGDGASIERTNPTTTSDISVYKSVSAGYQHTCGIRANDSRVLCWGEGNYGQLGDSSTIEHNVGNPNITTDSSFYSSVSAGYYHTCGIRQNDSRVLCWGRGDWGNLGDYSTAAHNVTTPNLTTDISAYSSASAGQYHTCGIRANDSRVLCWGSGTYGQLGDGLTGDHNSTNPNVTTDLSPYLSTLVSILGNAFLNIGETWKMGCRAYDFIDYSSWMNSSEITISSSNEVPNTPTPNLVSVDGTNKTLSNLNCSAVISDRRQYNKIRKLDLPN